MKKRTKEEETSYKRELRARKRSVPPVSHPDVTPIKEVSHLVPPGGIIVPPLDKCPTQCPTCVGKDLEIKKLLARIALLELQIKKGIKSDPLPTGDSAEDLYKRNLAAKNDRFRHYGLSAHG